MTTMRTRKIVRIDEAKCDGCGLCIPSCAEGAIRIVDGKARLLADNLCDGLGNCLGQCPKDAIAIEERPAEDFSEVAVAEQKAMDISRTASAGGAGCPSAAQPRGPQSVGAQIFGGGCPGARLRQLSPAEPAPTASPSDGAAAPGLAAASRLRQWPVQLSLVPPAGAIWQDADVLIAADCVGFALPDFHQRLLAGKTLVIACPKLDDVQPYVAKLTRIFADNPVRSVTVAHMEVPCCGGIVQVVRQAVAASGRDDLSVTDITVGIDGQLQAVR
jgi:Pyruvate/2-oxoacid:ferredoxin oxidoreductase delta subunit